MVLTIHLLLLVIGLRYTKIGMLDFEVYYKAVQCHAIGCNPWQLHLDQIFEGSKALPFLYTPIFLVIFHPLLSFDLVSAYFVWTLCMELLLVATYVLLALSLQTAGVPLNNKIKVIALSTLFLCGQTMEGLINGQVHIIIALAMLSYWYALSCKKTHIAGVSLALACLFKPFFGLGILCALWFRQWSTVFYFLLTLVIGFIASAMLGISSRDYSYYYNAMNEFAVSLAAKREFDFAPARFVTWGLRAALGIDHSASLPAANSFTVIQYAVICLLAWSFMRTPNSSPQSRMLACGIFSSIIPLSSPIIWSHYFLWSMFSFVLLFAFLFNRPTSYKGIFESSTLQNLILCCLIVSLGRFYTYYPGVGVLDIFLILIVWPSLFITMLVSAFVCAPEYLKRDS